MAQTDKIKILNCIGSSEPSTFGEFCADLKRAGIYPEEKGDWAKLFAAVSELEAEGLVEVDRNGYRLEAIILTEAGIASTTYKG